MPWSAPWPHSAPCNLTWAVHLQARAPFEAVTCAVVSDRNISPAVCTEKKFGFNHFGHFKSTFEGNMPRGFCRCFVKIIMNLSLSKFSDKTNAKICSKLLIVRTNEFRFALCDFCMKSQKISKFFPLQSRTSYWCKLFREFQNQPTTGRS